MDLKSDRKADFAHVEGNNIRCTLCPHNCLIPSGKSGICRVRKNKDGILYATTYDSIETLSIDPIEKKPLYHFLPGSNSLSLCTAGCNLRCSFCQNFSLSQSLPRGEHVSPEEIVKTAKERNCRSISFTYTEPTVFFELVYVTSRLAKKEGIKTVLVTNGFTSIEAIEKMSPFIDAANIDLKSFDDRFYKDICRGRLKPVLDAIKRYHELGVWIEITTLIIPGKNDSDDELKKIAGFIAGIDKEIPWHVSAFHPDYKMLDIPPTSQETLFKAHDIGQKSGLQYIYTGNIRSDRYNTTICPRCKEITIRRDGFRVTETNLVDGNCRFCGKSICKDQ